MIGAPNTLNTSYQVNYSSTSEVKKAENKKNNTVTSEDILNKIRDIGVAWVGVDELAPIEYRMLSSSTTPSLSLLTVSISSCILQRMVDDPSFRNEQLSNIQSHMAGNKWMRENLDHPFTQNLVLNSLFGGIHPFERCWSWSEGSNNTTQDIDGQPKEEYPSPAPEEGNSSLSQNMIQMFSQKFAHKVNTLAMQNDTYLFDLASNAYDRNSIHS